MRKPLLFTCFLLTGSLLGVTQQKMQLVIKSLPSYHMSGSDLYMAGSFNGWKPADSNYRFHKDDKGNYFINLALEEGSYEYKITRGGWDKTECLKGGTGMENRILNVPANGAVEINIEEWVDHFPSIPKKSTASKQVHIMDTAFILPQLQRTRKIWIYLPEDYDRNSKKRYPVLYMHDGQNLFDDQTSYGGEWGVDEFLDSTKLPACIVVGVDNGGDKRMNEYNPYDTDRFGKGEGDQYVDFLAKTLKPFIDSHYRTLKDKKNTLIAGSSMGGLISLYAVLKYPRVFGAAGVFSPSLWIAPKIFDMISSQGKKIDARIYIYAGGMEGESMTTDAQKAFDLLQTKTRSKPTIVIRKEGRHNEERWRKEFPAFYTGMTNNVEF